MRGSWGRTDTSSVRFDETAAAPCEAHHPPEMCKYGNIAGRQCFGLEKTPLRCVLRDISAVQQELALVRLFFCPLVLGSVCRDTFTFDIMARAVSGMLIPTSPGSRKTGE